MPRALILPVVAVAALAGCVAAAPPALEPVTAYSPGEVDRACVEEAADTLRGTLHVEATGGRALIMPPNGYDPGAQRKVEIDAPGASGPLTYDFACIVTPDGRALVQPLGRRSAAGR